MNNLDNIRQNGIGNGFTVSDPHDGFRKDNTLWFGKCDTCGETVTQSHFDTTWNHTVPVDGRVGGHVRWTTALPPFDVGGTW